MSEFIGKCAAGVGPLVRENSFGINKIEDSELKDSRGNPIEAAVIEKVDDNVVLKGKTCALAGLLKRELQFISTPCSKCRRTVLFRSIDFWR